MSEHLLDPPRFDDVVRASSAVTFAGRNYSADNSVIGLQQSQRNPAVPDNEAFASNIEKVAYSRRLESLLLAKS